MNQTENIADQEANAQLWIAFKQGNPNALGSLAQLHYRALYNYAYRFTHDSDFIRDCIQELYLELWERREFLSETAFVKSYLLKALRHKLIKESARIKRFQEPGELDFDATEPEASIETDIIRSESDVHVSHRLKNIIDQLPKRQQEVIYLRYYQNLSNEAIAEIMNLGKQSVANLLYRTLRDIRDIWTPTEYFLLLLSLSLS